MYSQSFIINFIFYLILCVTLISLILCLLTFYAQLNNNNLNLYKFKINNFFINILVILLYITVFLIFFYCLRLYNIGNYLDLKQVYLTFILIWKLFIMDLCTINKIFLILYSIVILIFILIIITTIIKKALLELYKLYIYIIVKPISNNMLWRWLFRINDIFTRFWDADIISYSIHRTFRYFSKKYKNKNIYIEDYDYFGRDIINILVCSRNYNNKYRLFVQFSPVLFLLYDCIFNNFIIVHFYYYMLIYTPVILFRNITTAIVETNGGFARILWHIYYGKEKNIYFIANIEQKNIIDILLRANLGYVTEFLLDMVEFYLQGSITYGLQDADNNIYWNNDANYLRIENKKIYEVIEDDDGNIFYKETKEYIFL